jgi:hypothetical protein
MFDKMTMRFCVKHFISGFLVSSATLLLLCPSPLLASSPAKNRSSNDGKKDSEETVPRASEIKQLLGNRFSDELVLAKRWNAMKDGWVIGSTSLNGSLLIALCKIPAAPSAVELIALNAPDDKIATDESLSALDLANYLLRPGETGIGIRITRRRGYSSGGASADYLHLYRLVDKNLVKVLSTPMSYYASLAGEWKKDGTRGRQDSAGQATLSVSKHVTQGFFDLTKKVKGGTSVTFKWRGTDYRIEGVDPIVKSDLDIFDN